ncbi:hypothetical protein B14911_11932 [Bacillus sp. NRRL B-14911]|nr:hypothetical protein B14911_11932 [Bacillus sp. NRRL B-14911]
MVASVTTSVTAGQNIKIDSAVQLDTSANANNSITVQFRLYRDGTLLTTRTLSRVLAAAGNQTFDIADTYVDTPPATNPASIYQLRVIVTAQTNYTAATVNQRNLNLIKF